jgi:hypothetical protein
MCPEKKMCETLCPEEPPANSFLGLILVYVAKTLGETPFSSGNVIDEMNRP